MIRHGRRVPSQCPKQEHFLPVLVTIFNISGGNASVRALSRNMAPMTNIECLSSPEILKMTTNTGGMLLFRALVRNMAPMTNHHDSTLRCFN